MASSFSKVDEYGFERPDDFDYRTYEDFMSSYLSILANRAKRWTELTDRGRPVKRSGAVKRYCRKGIPSDRRGLVWMAVSGANEMRLEFDSDHYRKLLNGDKDQDIIDIVRTDIPRTFPDNIFFNAAENHQERLYNVLIAFAHDNKEVGYCQGLNYIAGLLLLVTKNEETSFWLLKTLVEETLPKYYTNTMDGVIIDIAVLEELIRIKMPEIHQHVLDIGLPWAVITTKWFICVFAEVLPTETVLRIWDCIFYEGSKIIFRVCLTLIKRNSEALLQCNDFSDLADCFKNITKDALVVNCHDFMESIFKSPGSLKRSTIAKLRAKFALERESESRKTR